MAKPITCANMLAYAAPTTGTYFLYIPMLSILPAVYVNYFGLELTTIATAVLLIRLFDGITDPTIGYLADRHRANGGSRKTWAMVGGGSVIVTGYFLFIPVEPVTTVYYLCASFLFFLALTVFEIPHLSWGSELAIQYNERAKLYGFRSMFIQFGILLFYALPLMPFSSTNEYTPEVLRDAVIIGACLTIMGLVWMQSGVPSSTYFNADQRDSVRLVLNSVINNRPLLIYFLAYSFAGLSYGMWLGLLYFFLDSYLLLGDSLALIMTVSSLISIPSSVIWSKVVERSSKHKTWAVGMLFYCVHALGFAFVEPGVVWWIPLLLITISLIAFNCHNVAALSALGDIVDYAKLMYRKDRGATYFAVNNFLFKIALGVGGALSLGTAGFYGFSPTHEVHSHDAILGLKLGFLFLPIASMLIAMVFIVKTPITRRRHGIIESRLAKRITHSKHGVKEGSDFPGLSYKRQGVVDS